MWILVIPYNSTNVRKFTRLLEKLFQALLPTHIAIAITDCGRLYTYAHAYMYIKALSLNTYSYHLYE